MHHARSDRFQFSMRTLLVVTAAAAFLLVPVAWVSGERQRMLMAQRAMLEARETAIRSVVLEGARKQQEAAVRSGEARQPEGANPRSSPSRSELERENAELRAQVAKLRREVDRLRKRGGATEP
jgi:hypothetical protein